ncbi:MAG: hypothetical protein Q9216_002819 [Gyalolechia sp. 2 TL-2023]
MVALALPPKDRVLALDCLCWRTPPGHAAIPSPMRVPYSCWLTTSGSWHMAVGIRSLDGKLADDPSASRDDGASKQRALENESSLHNHPKIGNELERGRLLAVSHWLFTLHPVAGQSYGITHSQYLHITTATKQTTAIEEHLSLSVSKSPCMSMASSQVDPAMRPHGASDGEIVHQCEQSSVLSQCGSRSSPSVASADSFDLQTLQNLTSVPFETSAQELGSHLAYDGGTIETLNMFLDLELLSSQTPASPAEVFVDHGSSKHERYKLRCERNREVLAAVDHLFSDADRPDHAGTARGQRTEREPTVERQVREKPRSTTLNDLEKQSCLEDPESGDHRRRWTSSRLAVCLTILLAAVTWQYYNLVHT